MQKKEMRTCCLSADSLGLNDVTHALALHRRNSAIPIKSVVSSVRRSSLLSFGVKVKQVGSYRSVKKKFAYVVSIFFLFSAMLCFPQGKNKLTLAGETTGRL